MLNKKKILCFFNKKPPLYARLVLKQKKTAKQLIRNNSVYFLKNQAIFSQSKCKDRHEPPSTVHFRSLFKNPFPPLH